MRTVLIVSPHFPPISAPDMQRVRISLPYFTYFGWKPVVLTVDPAWVEGVKEALLLETIPSGVPIHRARALPASLTRTLGWGNVGLRAFPYLYRTGTELIKSCKVDLVYFSTTVFPTMALGRIWKRRLRVPFVVDLQDLWVSDYGKNGVRPGGPWKYRLARFLHGMLEPWTMKEVDGIIAVSAAYIETLQSRYPWLSDKPCRMLPFGGSEADFDIVRKHSLANRFFSPRNGQIHGVYVGRGGKDMAPALRIIFQALRLGLQEQPQLFSKLRLYFIGTDYATDHRARRTVEPIAEEFGVAEYIREYPHRIPYIEALQLLLDANFLLVPGSEDPQYTASKIYPYILARKPLLAVFHEKSSVVDILRRTRAGFVLPFTREKPPGDYGKSLFEAWIKILQSLSSPPEIDWAAFVPYTAREVTKQQCELFDQVLQMGVRV